MGQVFRVVLLGIHALDQHRAVVDLDDLHSAVLAALQRVAIVGKWPRGAGALEVHAFGADALLGKDAGHGAGPALGEFLVGLRAAAGVGVADHQDGGLLLAGEGAGQFAHLTLAIDAELGAADGKHALVFHLGDDAGVFRGGARGAAGRLQGFHLQLEVLFLGQFFQAVDAALVSQRQAAAGSSTDDGAPDNCATITLGQRSGGGPGGCAQQAAGDAVDGAAVVGHEVIDGGATAGA